MPRKYKRTTEKGNYSREHLIGALDAVKDGRALREVSRAFSIPRATLQKRIKQQSDLGPSFGRNTVFSATEEKALADRVIVLAKLFYGISRIEIKKTAYEYAEKNGIRCPFNKISKSAGDDWLVGFLRRNPNISLRKPEATSIHRITGFNKDAVALFYKNLDELLGKYHFSPNKVFNLDETGISTVQRPGKVFAQKGLKQVGFATSWERGKNVTVVCAFSAAGMYIPPMFIFCRKRMSTLLQKGEPPGAVYSCSDKGWITEDIFLEYLQHFQNHVKASKNDPVLLIMDNHVTHSTLSVYNFCKLHGISVLTIPPHTSHRLQPLDVTFYAPLKCAYNNECSKYLKNHPLEKITPFQLAEIFNNAYMRVATPEKAIKGFQITGICPYNPDTFSEEDFAPAEVQNQNDMKHETETMEVLPGGETIAASEPVEVLPVVEIQTASHVTLIVEKKNTSFDDILHLPGTSKTQQDTAKPKRKSTKQHSIILTSTPYKDVLEEKHQKKTKKKTLSQNNNNPPYKRKVFAENATGTTVAACNTRTLRKEKENVKFTKEQNGEESFSEDADDEETDKNVDGDICLVCGEFGKNRELWLRCISCGMWAHRACSNTERKAFICDYCL